MSHKGLSALKAVEVGHPVLDGQRRLWVLRRALGPLLVAGDVPLGHHVAALDVAVSEGEDEGRDVPEEANLLEGLGADCAHYADWK